MDDILPEKPKKYNSRIHFFIKFAAIQASLKKNEGIEGYVYHEFFEKRKKIKSKYKIQDLVRTAALRQLKLCRYLT